MKSPFSIFPYVALLIYCVYSANLTAHEGRPVYVEIKPIENVASHRDSSSHYILRWKTPPVFASGTEPRITIQNPSCQELRPKQKGRKQNQKLIGQRRYQCPETMKDLKVKITYPGDNPALSSLVVFYNEDGLAHHIYSGPDELIIPVNSKMDALAVSFQYVTGGIKHILLGWDHLLFVFCLIILAGNISRLLITITGFTLAHTVTLIASTLNFLTVPILFIEVLIALSIALLSAEIVRYTRNKTATSLTHQYPIIAASVLGLLHGFGFASVLTDLGLPQDMKLTALLFFNLGIELGQLIFISGSLVLIYLLSRHKYFAEYKERILLGALYFVGICASYWVVERFIALLYP